MALESCRGSSGCERICGTLRWSGVGGGQWLCRKNYFFVVVARAGRVNSIVLFSNTVIVVRQLPRGANLVYLLLL